MCVKIEATVLPLGPRKSSCVTLSLCITYIMYIRTIVHQCPTTCSRWSYCLRLTPQTVRHWGHILHPSILFHLSRVGCSREFQASLSPARHSSSSQCSQIRWAISPLQRVVGVPQDFPNTSNGRRPGSILIRLYANLPLDVWAPYPMSKAEARDPREEAHFGHLFPQEKQA